MDETGSFEYAGFIVGKPACPVGTRKRESPMLDNFSRREFHKLTAAALGGMVAGTLIGCGSEKNPAANSGDKSKEGASAAAAAGTSIVIAAAIHACRGLNECKGLGASAKNDCAGLGDCATVKHDCATMNDCKHQGGCGEAPGFNDCKTKGGCSVPIGGAMWEKARAKFEQQMKAAGKQFGPAPAKS